MSDYSWYITQNGERLSVSYMNPGDDIPSLKVTKDDKATYHANFITNVGGVGRSFDLKNATDKEQEYIRYYQAFKQIFQSVLTDLIIKGDAIRSVWKMPDPLSCLLYASTEASEYLESVLLQVRNKDSRNNKKLEDYDSATEMFDFTMMQMRFLISYCETIGITDQDEIAKYIGQLIDRYIADRLNPEFLADRTHKFRYDTEPIQLLASASGAAEYYMNYCHDFSVSRNPELFDEDMLWIIMNSIEYVIFHPLMLNAGTGMCDYTTIAYNKINKIYEKSMAKMGNET